LIRTVWVYLVGGLATFYYAGKTIVRTLVSPGHLPFACDRAARSWATVILRAAGVEVRLHGAEHLLTDSPQIIIANHQSWFDVFALAAHLPVRYRFVAKRELEGIPLFGRAWKRCGHVSVDRGNRKAAIESLDQAWREVHEDKLTMVIFPEGTRSPDGELKGFKKGAFVLAVQARVPLVPAAVCGSREIMPKGGRHIGTGIIHIRFGPPIPTEGLAIKDRDSLMKEAWDALRGLLEKGVGEEEPNT
jgi:1-acyl-sn-glycerol-3-phosphate acyltransferase